MIEEDEFLDRSRIEFAINAEFERDFRHAIGFASGVDSESVRLAFRHPRHRVAERGQDKKERAQDERKQRQASGIGDAAHSPAISPASDRAFEKGTRERESDQEKNAKVERQLNPVVENIMAHFVRHYGAYFRKCALLEKIIVQRDSRRPEKSGDVRAYLCRLS